MSLSDRMTNGKAAADDWAPLQVERIDVEAPSTLSGRNKDAFNVLYERVQEKEATVFEPMYSGSAQAHFQSDHPAPDDHSPADPVSGQAADEPVTSSFPATAAATGVEEKQAVSTPRQADDNTVQADDHHARLEAAVARGEKDGYAAGFAKGEQEGYETGLAKGQQEGFEAGLVSASEKISFLEQLLAEMEGIRSHLVQRSEKQIMQMICRIAEKVVYTEGHLNHEIVKGAILQSFEEISELEDVTINVNSEDYDFIQIVKDDFFKQYKDLKQISILSNPSIARGGCKVETHSGQVETSIESRLEAVKNSILNVAGAHS